MNAYDQAISKNASWVIVNKETKQAVFETYQKSLCDKINTQKYTVIPIAEYLHSLNHKMTVQGGN